MVSKEGSGLSDITLEDIAAGKYSICVGDDSVPAGNYAAQSLSTVGVYTPAAADEARPARISPARAAATSLRRCRP